MSAEVFEEPSPAVIDRRYKSSFETTSKESARPCD
jgi:hypothetical protein